MKKKISLVLALMLIMSMLSGCTTDQVAYFAELEKVSTWDSYESTIDSTITADIMNMAKVDMKINGTAKSDVKNQKSTATAKIEMSANDIAWKYSDLSAKYTYPKLEMYMDKGAIYINKEYVLGLLELMDAIPEDLKDMKQGYFKFNLTEDETFGPIFAQILESQNSNANLIDKIKTLFSDYNSKIEIKKSGRDYTIKLDSDQFVDEFVNYIDYVVANEDKFAELLTSASGITTEDLEAAKDLEDKEEVKEEVKDTDKVKKTEAPDVADVTDITSIMDKEDLAAIKAMLKGSTIEVSDSFSDNKYTEVITVDLKIESIGTAKIVINTTSQKTSNSNVVIPSSVLDYTLTDLINTVMPTPDIPSNTVMINVTAKNMSDTFGTVQELPIPVLEKNGVTYVPFRTVIETLGLQVGYDKATNTVYYVNNQGIQTTVNVVVSAGVSYISQTELMANGFDVYVDDSAAAEYGVYWYINQAPIQE